MYMYSVYDHAVQIHMYEDPPLHNQNDTGVSPRSDVMREWFVTNEDLMAFALFKIEHMALQLCAVHTAITSC